MYYSSSAKLVTRERIADGESLRERRPDSKRDPRARMREQGRRTARAAKYTAQGRKG